MQNDEKNNETRGDFVNKITEAFDKFVGTFKKHGIASVTFIFVLFLLLYSFIINPISIKEIVDKAIENNNSNISFIEDKAFEKRLQADRLLIPILNEIVEENDSIQRAIICEMHNGITTKGHLDLLYLSATFETIDSNYPELDLIGDFFQKQPLNSLFGHGVDNLMLKKYVYYTDIGNKNVSSRFARKLSKLGINSVMLVPIKDENDVPLIILVIASEYNFNPETEYVKIKPLLSNINNILTNDHK